jgi:hypothetical protein
MGYSRDDSLIALQISENNLEAACTFLINNPNPSVSMPGLTSQLGRGNSFASASRDAQINFAT